ncbi:uncharacterized protein LOC112552856 [Pogonomyrmex barbatus]|uniref:Uncharacterized protein LOC112552856 n=1 Tax=Pogonomyrmex barbatus TaxID=144034 RepID=A0A8N1S831_9HYME|nr:uncharacterized protein LOC112552856 [Pogonomyrmex barbatus]
MLMQNIMYLFTRDIHSISNLTHLDSSIIHTISWMDFINDFWSSLNRAFSITCAHMATPTKRLKPFINCSNRRNHSTSSIQTNVKCRKIDQSG